jgi:DNA-binding transcriptional LysR family regulator
MLFRQLEYFVALARERHFARAAAACYVSQPALSEAIRKLEKELGVSLVRRERAFEGLTPEGERLVVWARRILADHDALTQEVTAIRSGLSGQLRIGVIPAASTTAALIIEPFCEQHPLVNVQLDTRMPSRDIIDRLHRFELDAGIIYLHGSDTTDLVPRPLYRERHVLIGADHLLPTRADHITFAEVAQLPLCLLDKSMRGRQELQDALSAHGLMVTPQVETDSVAALHALVGTGRWASVVPYPWSFPFAQTPGLRTVSITDPEIVAPVGLVVSAAQPGSVLGRALADTTRPLPLDELTVAGQIISAQS